MALEARSRMSQAARNGASRGGGGMNVIAEPKIDCHMHVLDPARFPYNPSVAYKPAGQEIGTPAQYDAVMDFYGVTHALLVQPNSGFGIDKALLLRTVASG